MKLGISRKYALWFGAVSFIILAIVLITSTVIVWRSAHVLREELRRGAMENFEAIQYTTMINIAEFLRRRLFTPLYDLDIERIDNSLNDLYKGLPITSARIADSTGKVLTDGTGENRSYGARLRLDRERLKRNPVLIESIPGGRRVTFLIGFKGYIEGYGELIFSEAPVKRAVERGDRSVMEIWRSLRDSYVKIALTWTFFIALVAVLLSVVFSKTLARPLVMLRDATAGIAKGELHHRVEIGSRDEIGELAESFNRMVDDLEERTAELRKTNQALEQEIAERKRAEKAIRYQASHDPLTGLPNRTLFTDRLGLELAEARRRRVKLAVFFLDLDRFKNINDTLGHAAGDELLKQAAVRLKSELRDSDTIARIGGDEFNLILTGVPHSDAVADIARKILRPFQEPFHVGTHKMHIATSIGISMYPDDGEFPDILLKNADIALYNVKEQGGNGFQFYDPGMNTATIERMMLENSLRRTLERNELVLRYQPQIEIKTGKIVCAEALLRWNHRDMGLLDPADFIPLAEEIGLMTAIDEWVLRSVCRQIRVWEQDGVPSVCITVNLSAREFQNPHLAGKVQRILAETGVSPDCLDIEITETLAMSNIERTAMQLRQLSEIGVHVSIDDFGTGYSSLNYLKRLPIERIKIDKSFIHDLATDPDDRAIIQAVTAMAHKMKMKVIAEGVETRDQLSFLSDTECDVAQGFLFSKAVREEELREMIAAAR